MPPPINKDKLRSCYFFFGPENFIAEQFVLNLKEVLFAEEGEDGRVEKFSLDESTWAAIIDVARTIPFFTARRLVLVEVSDTKGAKLSSADETVLTEYFEMAPSQTVMVVVAAGPVKRSSQLVKFFQALPSAHVLVEEMKPLKGRDLATWIGDEFRLYGKDANYGATSRLAEVAGNELGRLHNEIEKIAIYVGDKKQVDADDINQISGWVKSFIEWEITENLEKGDYKQSLLVLDKLLNKEGTSPVNILGIFSRFFSNLLLAKFLLRERAEERKAIFKRFKPQIQEKFGGFYTRKFNEFFALVDRLSVGDLNRFLSRLADIDLQLKTASPSFQALIEGFLFEYCRFLGEERVILRGRR